MSQSEDEDSVPVKTTVPRSQKDAWATDADTLNMSQSEFVRTMVQAGRSGIEAMALEGGSDTSHPRGNVLETAILDVVSEPCSFDDLENRIQNELDSLLEECVSSLHERNEIEYTPRGELQTVE